MKLASLSLYIIILLTCGIISAEAKPGDDKPALPSGPLLHSWSPEESWTIRFTYLNPNADIPNDKSNNPLPEEDYITRSLTRPSNILIDRSDPYLSVRFTDSKGKVVLGYYTIGNFTFQLNARTNRPSKTSLPQREPYLEFSTGEEFLLKAHSSAFYGLDWVSAKTYTGVETVEEIPCFVFEKNGTRILISQKTRHPVLWQTETELRRFIYNGKPDPNHIPKSVLARMEGMKRDLERLTKSVKGG